MRELFIYYRSHAADTPQLQEAARGLQQALRVRYPWLEVRWLKRSEQRDELVTWMEIYRSTSVDADAIDAATCRDIESLAAGYLSTWVVGPRHVEEFETCAW